EVSDRAVRLAAAHRRAIRPTRCIHQDTALVAGEELVVGTGRSVAGHATAPRLTHAALRDEVTYCRYPLDARRKAAVPGHSRVPEFDLELRCQRERDVKAIRRQEAIRAIRPFEQH